MRGTRPGAPPPQLGRRARPRTGKCANSQQERGGTPDAQAGAGGRTGAPPEERGVAWPTIVKTPDAFPVAPNLGDYERGCAAFSWADARRELAGLPGDRGLNIAHEA